MGQKPFDQGSGASRYKIKKKKILDGFMLHTSSQGSIRIRTSALIYNANQLTGFYKKVIGLQQFEHYIDFRERD